MRRVTRYDQKEPDTVPGRRRILSNATVVVAASDKLSCGLAEEEIILDLKSGVYFGLDIVGARIWRLIQEPRTVGDLCQVIVEEYDVDPDCCERDVVAFLQDLLAQGLARTEETVG